MRYRPSSSIVALICLFLGWSTSGCGPARRAPAPPPAAAAPRSTALLWQVEHAGNVSYLFGTIHLNVDVDAVLGTAGRAALDRSRVLYVEMDLSDAQRTRSLGAAAVQAGLLPPGESLRGMLSPALWAQLQQLLPGSPPATLERLRPWLAALSVIQVIAARSHATPASQGAAFPPMDVTLVARARAHGIPILELDSMQQQLEAFTAMPRDQALAMLRELLEAPETAGRELHAIVDAYDSADAEQRLTALVGEMARRTPVFTEYLLFRRNQRWADALDGSLRAGGVFVAVGAGHLVGPRGLPALLARRGFRVQRVP